MPFTPGNIVVYRVGVSGAGSAALTSAATAVFLDEYTPSGALVQSIALPTVDGAANNQTLTASGTATSEGMLTRSADGQYLILTGYDAAPGTAGVTGSSTTMGATPIVRVIGRVGVDGSIDTTTTTTQFSGNNIRAATSLDGTQFWETGGNSGVIYQAFGATGAGTVISTTVANLRDVLVVGGQLYVSTSSGSAVRIGAVGTGTPTTSGQTITTLPGIPTSTGSPYEFFFADLTASVAGVDTLYVADDSTGLTKYSLVGGTWVSNGTVAGAARGLTGTVSGSTVTLFETTTATSANSIVSIVDTGGYNVAFASTATVIATAAANTAFRGVALAPQAIMATPAAALSIAAPATAALAEGGVGATTDFVFTVIRSNGTGASSATYTVIGSGANPADAADFASQTTGTVSFADTETSKTITVKVAGDTAVEANEGFTVTLSAPTNASIATASAAATILNDDASFAIANGSANEGAAGGIPLVVTRSGDTSAAATLDYAVTLAATDTASAADFTGGALPVGTVTFAAGATSATIAIAVLNDTVAESDETFTVTLSGAGANQSITTATATGTIVNDDAATSMIGFQTTTLSQNEGNTAPTAYTYTLTRTGSTAAAATVGYAVAANGALNAADFAGGVLPSGTATFAAGSATTTVTVNVAADRVIENDETFTLALSNPGAGYAIGAGTGSATGTIVNDDGTIIPGGTQTTVYTVGTAGNYALLDGVTRTQTAGGGVAVTATTGTANIDIQGTLTDTASGQVAVNFANTPIAGLLMVEAAGAVQSLNANAVVDASVNGTINLTDLGQILATVTPFTPSVGGTNPGTAFAVTYNVAKGATTATATDYTSGGTIINGSTTNATALIRSDNGDAVRLGSHETLVNYGIINGNGPINDAATNNIFRAAGANSVAQTYDVSRGVRLNQSAETAVRIDNFGTITGAQHGVDMGQTNITNAIVVNEAGGRIIGRNGSGVGADTTGAAAATVTVVNSGLIEGDRAVTVIDRAGYTYTNGTGDSDGDGVDIDGGATITNNAGGRIIGNGASGYDSAGRANASEGISIGGGIVVNAGAISGADAAIVVNNDGNADNSRSGLTATTITNFATGTITGVTSYAIRLENKTGGAADNDAIVNYGAITGNGTVPTGTVARQDGTADGGTVGTLDGTVYTAADAGNARFIRGDGAAIQTGEGVDTLANYGMITGNSGRAVNLEGGNDALTLFTGSAVTGRIDGGAGSDTLTLRLDDRPASAGGATGNNSGATTGTLANVVNFEALDVAGGIWTIADAQGYAAGSTIETGATLVLGTGAALTGAVVDNGRLIANGTGALTLSGAISGSGVVEQAGSGTLTLGAASSYTGGTALSAGTLDIAAVGAAGTWAITFAAGAQTLRIESAALSAGTFAPAIAGFATDGDTIDVRGIGLATTGYDAASGILTLTGTSTARLNVGTGYGSFVFTAGDDGAGGTAVTVALPTLTIGSPTIAEGNAGGTSVLRYVVTSSAPAPAGGISFDIATADGTATAGSDYVARTVTGATIAAGQTSYSFDVQVNGDTTPERAETVLVNLSNPARATIAVTQGVGTIDNDDGAPAGLQAYFATDFTGFAAAGFAPTPTAAQLNSNIWRVTGLSDNTSPVFGGTYTAGDFARGVINGAADPVSAGVYSPSANAALIVQPTGAEFENGGFIEAQLVNTTGFTATSFAIEFDWAFRNNAARSDNLALSYSTDGVTYTTLPAAAFSTPSDAVAGATFANQHESVTIDNVLVGDGSPLYLRWIHTGSTGGGNRDEVGIDNVVVRAAVSDIQTLAASDISVSEGTGGQSFATFTITRSSGTGSASVAYATADGTASAGSDYTAASGTLTFGEGERSKTVSVALNPDSANEANETFFLNLSRASGVTVTDPQARATILNDDTGPVAIYNLQGAGHISPFNGQVVTTTGIVTAINATGFWLQDPLGDGIFATSDGIQVFIGAAPTGVAVGDSLVVSGTISEFTPTAGALSVTELTAPTITLIGRNNALPAPVLIGIDGILPPTNVIDDDRLQVFDPQHDGIDFYEALEGMLVTIQAPMVTASTLNRGTYVVASQGQGATNIDSRGGIVLTGDDGAPERIQIFADSTLLPGYNPAHTVGDLLGNVTGIVSYYSFPELLPTQPVTVVKDVSASREQTLLRPDADHLQIASFNIENADPTDPQAKFDAIGVEIVNALGRPDIIGLQEVQDADGAGSGTNLSGQATAQKVIDAIIAAGGPTYTYIEIAPDTANSTGGEPNGNIRNGYLYNAARVSYVTGSVALIQDPAFANTRKPLVAGFVFNGTTVTVIDQHSTSRGGSDLSFGANQPPAQAGDAARTAQATAIKAYINTLQATDPNAHVVALGDFNGYYYEPALSTLTADGKLTNLYTLLPVEERYSYVFEGASQAFDNIIVSSNLVPNAQFDVVHYNAEQPVQIITDHDQAVASLYIPRVNTAPSALAIDTGSVAENAPAGRLVGTVSGTDTAGDTLTYALTDNGGGRFTIDPTTGRITTTQPLDYETVKAVFITVRATDQGGLTFDKAFTVTVTDVNETPAALSLSGTTVAENAVAGTVVGTLAGMDADADQTLRYSLVDDGGGRFAVDATTGRITTTRPLDYETLTSVAITARVTDQGGLTFDKAFTVAVTDVNEAPTGVSLSNLRVTENATAGTVIGTLSATDPDAAETFTYTVNDARFRVDGNQLVVAPNAVIDYETQQSVALTVTATDHGGLSTTATLTLAVQDVPETITGTSGNDTITGGPGVDIIDAGAGDDIVNGGPGADRLTLGAGADIVRGLLGDLSGDTILDFSMEDRIVVQRSDLHRSDLSVTGTGASTVLNLPGGTVALSAGLSGGDVMVAHSSTDAIISYNGYLAQLDEGRAVAGPAVNGIVNQAYLAGDTSTSFTVRIETISGAHFDNSLGVYEIDTRTGAIVDVRIVAANVKTAGTITVTGVEAGHQLGFFLVQNGAHTLSSAVQSSTSLSVIDQGGHLVLADHGTAVSGATTFFSHAAAANVDGAIHVLSGVAADGSGDLRIGFEDLLRSGSGSDDDFQDVVLTVDAVPQVHPTADIWHQQPIAELPMLYG